MSIYSLPIQYVIKCEIRHCHNLPFCPWALNNSQISVFADHCDVTEKLTFDILDIKCHHFILSLKTFVWNLVLISVWVLGSEWPWPLTTTFSSAHLRVQVDISAKIWRNSIKAFLRCRVHKNGVYRHTDIQPKEIMPQLSLAESHN